MSKQEDDDGVEAGYRDQIKNEVSTLCTYLHVRISYGTRTSKKVKCQVLEIQLCMV